MKFVGKIIFMLLCLLSVQTHSQADTFSQLSFTQVDHLSSLYNPSMAGNSEYLRINLGGRFQDVGIEDYARNFIGVIDLPIEISSKYIGAGVAVSKLNCGGYSNFVVDALGNYQIKLKKGTFAFGVDIGWIQSRFTGEPETIAPEEGDSYQPMEVNDDLTSFKTKGNALDIGVGISYKTNSFNIGIAVMHLNSPSIKMREGDGASTLNYNFLNKLPATLYFSADGNIAIPQTLFTLQPALFIASDFKRFCSEIKLESTYSKWLNFGLAYRLNDAVSAMLGISFKNIFIGYAYDIPAGHFSQGSKGSHELVLGYRIKLGFDKKHIYSRRSIRIM